MGMKEELVFCVVELKEEFDDMDEIVG